MLYLFILNSYSQEVRLQLNTNELYSTTNNLYPKILLGINENEKMDKSSHIIECFKDISAANDSTLSVELFPIIKINFLKKAKDDYILTSEEPFEIYGKPSPFSGKIYIYKINNESYNTGMLGSYSANFVTSALSVNKNLKPLCFAYFLEKDRYLNNFLILENSKNEFLIVDRNLNLFQNINDFIKNHYGGSVENLLWLIKTKTESKNNIALIILNDSIVTGQELIIDPINYDKFDFLNFDNEKLKNIKDLWKYDVIANIKTKPNTLLLNIEEFYEKYHIKPKDKKLKICVDKKFNPEMRGLWIDPSFIIAVKIIKDVYLLDGLMTKLPEIYINIETKKK